MYSLRTKTAGQVDRLTVHSPAKVNLTLEVLNRRADGFHELETLMLAVSVCDTLIFEPCQRGLLIECEWASGLQAEAFALNSERSGESIWQPLPATTDNLVWKALEQLRSAAGISAGARVQLIKRVPAQAGLGGASADAAAALLAANEAWRLYWPRARLADLATTLGSDVAFFLSCGAALCRGRGDQIQAIRPPHCALVIVRPPLGLSTQAVYRHCRPEPARQAARQMQAAFVCGDFAAAARCMHNGLQPAAEQLSRNLGAPWIARLRQVFSQSGCIGHQMSGSGSSYFGLCWHAGQARRIARRLRSMRLGAVLVAHSVGSTVERVLRFSGGGPDATNKQSAEQSDTLNS